MKTKKIVITILIVGTIVVIGFLIFSKRNKQTIRLETTVANVGDVINSVTATGTVEPIDKIDVGTQVSGVIDKIYVDFNSNVKKGQLLAELDKLTLKARLFQAQADLASAQNELTFQEQNYNRTKKLYETSLVSEVDYESAQYKYNSAKTSVDRLKSALDQALVNLSYASIYSPIDGVVLARNVEEGQTVAASFSTPTLFAIAKDLTKMKVEANVDEADIGQVKVNQRVTFTVDAFPADTFEGKVTQIRLNPTVSSNVVTYKVIVEAPNPDYKLMPGLTASISIITKESSNAIVVPVKALTFTPDQDVAEIYMPKPPKGELMANNKKMLPSVNRDMMPKPEIFGENQGIQAGKNEGVVWVKHDKTIEPRMVKKGLSDGAFIEIQDGLQIGDTIVTSATKQQIPSTTNSQSRSPFMPTPPQRTRRN